MSPDTPGNVAKLSGECCQTFRGMYSNTPGMLANIPGNFARHSAECPQRFCGMLPKIPGNVLECLGGMLPDIPGNAAKNSGECPQTFWRMSVLLKGMSPRFHGICSTEYCMDFVAVN